MKLLTLEAFQEIKRELIDKYQESYDMAENEDRVDSILTSIEIETVEKINEFLEAQ